MAKAEPRRWRRDVGRCCQLEPETSRRPGLEEFLRLGSSWRKATAEAEEEMGAGAAPWPPGSGRDGGRRGGRTSRLWILPAPPPPSRSGGRSPDRSGRRQSWRKYFNIQQLRDICSVIVHRVKCFQTGLRFALFRGLLLTRSLGLLLQPGQVGSVSMTRMTRMFLSPPDL